MAEVRRGTEEIRRDISTEREQLVGALGDLRTGVRSTARRIPVVLAAGAALAAVVAVAKRRLSDGD